MHDRETGIMQAVRGRATVVAGEDKHAVGVGEVLVIPGGRCPTRYLTVSRWWPR
jgi:mannose-6-phosphate isomerase-like protein (cupin superfamily)